MHSDIITHQDFLFVDKFWLKFYSQDWIWFPRTGIYLYEYITKNTFIEKYKNVSLIVDIWTWKIWFLANILGKLFISARVVWTEFNEEYFVNLKYNIFSENVSFLKTDPFPFLNAGVDLFISNPPQMPTPHLISIHDSWGFDGLDIFENILKSVSLNKSKNGTILVVNLFDFLWVVEDFGRKRSVKKLISEYGWNVINISTIERKIRKWWETDNNLNHIRKIAPEYILPELDSHIMYILEIYFENNEKNY